MKLNRGVALLLAFAMIFTMTACAPKQTPKERLEEAFTNALDLKSSESDFALNLTVDMEETGDPMMGMILSMLENVQIEGHTKSLISEDQDVSMELTGSAATAGMTYEAELYMTPETMAMKIPMVPQYLVQEMPETADKDLSVNSGKAFAEAINASVLKQVKEENLTVENDIELTVGEHTEKGTLVSLALSDAEAKELTHAIVNELFQNEQFVSMMIQNQQKQYAAMGLEMSEEELRAEISTQLEEFNATWAEAIQYINIEKYNMSFLLNKDNQNIGSTVDMDIHATDEATGLDMKVHMDMQTVVYSINALTSEDVFFPELTEENSMPMEEMGGGY